MEKDTEKTPVIFRKYRDGSIIALFPTLPGTLESWTCLSYEHVGQHRSAYYDGVIIDTKPAKPEEYKDLFRELKNIGYNLKVYQKSNNLLYETRKKNLHLNL